MRELDRIASESTLERCAIVGAGRLGHALAAALRAAGVEVEGPLGRGARPQAEGVLLRVPAREIRAPAEATPARRPAASDGTRDAGPAAGEGAPRFVGHCSGATTLEPLHPHEGFSLHPLITVPEGGAAPFEGAGCAVAGTTPRALHVAEAIAQV